jgi:hypothetical protein
VSAAVAAGAVTGPGITPRVGEEMGRDEFAYWLRTNVRPQKQPGYAIVTVTTVLGDLTGAQMRMLGQLALAFSDGTVRITSDQNVVLRWVPDARAAGALRPSGRRRALARGRVDARRRHQLPRAPSRASWP